MYVWSSPPPLLHGSGGPRTPPQLASLRDGPSQSARSRRRGQTAGGQGFHPVYSRNTRSSQVVDPTPITLSDAGTTRSSVMLHASADHPVPRRETIGLVSGPQCSRLFYITDKTTGTRFLVDTGAEVSVIPHHHLIDDSKQTFSSYRQ